MPYRRGVGYGPYRGAGGQVRWQEGHQYQMRRREDYGARHLSQDFFSAPGAITLVHAIRSPWSAAEHSPHRHQERARYDSCQQNNFTEAPGGHPSRTDHLRGNMSGGFNGGLYAYPTRFDGRFAQAMSSVAQDPQ